MEEGPEEEEEEKDISSSLTTISPRPYLHNSPFSSSPPSIPTERTKAVSTTTKMTKLARARKENQAKRQQKENYFLPYFKLCYKRKKELLYDIRCQYPLMFINAYNSNDASLLTQYFQRYYTGHVRGTVMIRTADSQETPIGMLYCEKNVREATEYWTNKMETSPDTYAKLHSTNLILNSNGTSQNIHHTSITSSHLLYFPPDALPANFEEAKRFILQKFKESFRNPFLLQKSAENSFLVILKHTMNIQATLEIDTNCFMSGFSTHIDVRMELDKNVFIEIPDFSF